MKRTITTLAVLLLTAAAWAGGYTAAQEKLRADIRTMLAGKGYQPQLQDDGLKYTRGGATHYIEITPGGDMPAQVRICRYVKLEGKLTAAKIAANTDELNKMLGAKVICKERNVEIAVDVFAGNAAQVKVAFEFVEDIIDSVYSKIKTLSE